MLHIVCRKPKLPTPQGVHFHSAARHTYFPQIYLSMNLPAVHTSSSRVFPQTVSSLISPQVYSLFFFSPSAFLIIMYLGCEMSATIYCTRCGYSLTTDTVAVIIYIYILYFMTATTKYLNNLLNRKIIDVSLCFFAGKLC